MESKQTSSTHQDTPSEHPDAPIPFSKLNQANTSEAKDTTTDIAPNDKLTTSTVLPITDPEKTCPTTTTEATPASQDDITPPTPVKYINLHTALMGIIVSMGGLIFGYGGIGQIGGFLLMPDYRRRFGDQVVDGKPEFSDVRAGTIVGLLLIGALVGSLLAAPLTDRIGRKWSISIWAAVFAVGQLVEICTVGSAWYQIVVGRTVEGLGIGGLSILTPMYQSETAPKEIRGAMISTYQLFITLGILLASLVNFGTHSIDNSSSWRVTMGIGLMWAIVMAVGTLFLDESPRWNYRHGFITKAGHTIARTYRVSPDHPIVISELEEIQEALDIERAAGDVKWHEVFTAPTMLRRIIVGMVLQMLQQLTGANYFFYYGTAIFSTAKVGNSYITAVILGSVNFVATFVGIWSANRHRHRNALIDGAALIGGCLLIYASIGRYCMDNDCPLSKSEAGGFMVVFSCFAIIGFATTWGPLPWVICAEIYPIQYRATCMALATASNWTWNFLIGFFTPFITNALGYSFGYVFAAAILAGAFFVHFFVHETSGKSLEAIDRMILERVRPWKSTVWEHE